MVHPTIETRKKIYVLQDFGEQGSPISTTMLQNGVDTARHVLIFFVQLGATDYTELLEAYVHQYRTFVNAFLMNIIDFPAGSGGSKIPFNKKHLDRGMEFFCSSGECGRDIQMR